MPAGIVLASTDAICFIADSQRSQRSINNEAYAGMQSNLCANGIDPDRVPTVIQFNKRDLGNVRSEAEIGELARRGREPVYLASAVKGEGVLECFFGLLEQAWQRLNEEHDLTEKLGMTPAAFLDSAAANLGYAGRARALADARVGGARRPR